ncbi:MAG TPA: carbon storage regulator CsrA [Solirubrobacteraceae bacterium]|nr:carbon storage regulator CsrA [Solirubrobacteraceae bacterium]
MLILTRRPGERVVIGDEVLVTVMSVSGHTVRLGIAAPQGVPIYREEIWLAVKEENRAAAAASTDALPSTPPGAPGAQNPPGADAGPVPAAEEAGSGAAE